MKPSITEKAEATRARILDVALAAFQTHGFEGATMREIARRAGVATGAAYYYFPSKESLVMEFYGRLQARMAEEARTALAGKTDLAQRIAAVIDANFEHLRPHRPIFAALFRVAADPESPLSPFGHETEDLRRQCVDVFREAIDGSKVKVPRSLRTVLPELLWLYYMGIVLFWIHDRSPDSRRTAELTRTSLKLVTRLIQLGSQPWFAPLRNAALGVVRSAWPSEWPRLEDPGTSESADPG